MVTVEPLDFNHSFGRQINQIYDGDDVSEGEGHSYVPTDYDENGVLATQMTSFVDIRLLPQSMDTVQNEECIVLVHRDDSFGPSSYCRLGPPKPPTHLHALVEQEHVRGGLSNRTVGGHTAQGTSKEAGQEEQQDGPQSEREGIIVKGGDVGRLNASVTNPDKGPQPKRSRSLHSAVGPILRLLRNA
jgi:hypothetical protein